DASRTRALHRRVDTLARPFRVIAQDPLGKPCRILEADATMTEITPRAGEELRRRRAVHVDVLRVGEDELREAKRVLRPWPLADVEAAGNDFSQVLVRYRQRRRVVFAAGHDLHVFLVEVR